MPRREGFSVIVCSRIDPASMNVRERLLELFSWSKSGIFDGSPVFLCEDYENVALVTVSCDLTLADYLDKLPFRVRRYVFASRHESAARVPALLAHFPGNWLADTRFGGQPKRLSIADPIALKAALRTLKKMQEELGLGRYDVTAEATHHGPTNLRAPCVFVEIGSCDEDWRDPRAGEAVARACMEAAIAHADAKNVALGFGGTHYVPKFTKIILEKDDWFMSHMASKYVIIERQFDPEMLRHAVMRSSVRPRVALLDWKGLNAWQRNFLKRHLSELGLEVKRAAEVLRS